MQAILETLPPKLKQRLQAAEAPKGNIFQIRLRSGKPIELHGEAGTRTVGGVISHRELSEITAALQEHSLYNCEETLAEGYFTTRSGLRVGAAGRYAMQPEGVRLIDVHSLCIRIPGERKNCADPLMPLLRKGYSCLILSAPGCGKTTIIRDAARQLSDDGKSVAILDERKELASVWQGVPTMDVGSHTDVIEGIGKSEGIPRIVRALAPDVLVMDELGGQADAEAVQDALRCGVQVLATAHAEDLRQARERSSLALLTDNGFRMAAELTEPPGTLRAVYIKEENSWKRVVPWDERCW